MASGANLKSQKDNLSRIQKKIIPDPGGKKAPVPGPGSATLNYTTSLYSYRPKRQRGILYTVYI
jgi:hypothetical protein